MTALIAFDESDDPATRLWRLGRLKIEYFQDVIKAGEAERRTSTLNDPLNAPGTRDYFARVRTLRETLIKELGWKRHNRHMMPLVINETKTLGIGVVLGDALTGVPGPLHPKSLRPLGDVKQSLVEQNQVQGTLFDIPVSEEASLDEDELANLDTWFFVTRRTSRGDKITVQSELSRPVRLDAQGFVIEWSPRICLPPQEFEGVIDYIEGTDDGPEFEVNVDEH